MLVSLIGSECSRALSKTSLCTPSLDLLGYRRGHQLAQPRLVAAWLGAVSRLSTTLQGKGNFVTATPAVKRNRDPESCRILARMACITTGQGTLKAKDSLIMQQPKKKKKACRSLGLALEGSQKLHGGTWQCQPLVLSVPLWQWARCALGTHSDCLSFSPDTTSTARL